MLWSWDYLRAQLGVGLFVFSMVMLASFAVLPFQYGFFLLDTRKSPALLYKHKIQTSEKAVMKDEAYERAWRHHFEMYANTMVCVASMTYFMGEEDRSLRHTAPGIVPMAIEIAILSVCNEIGFYWSHRLLHVPYFYKRHLSSWSMHPSGPFFLTCESVVETRTTCADFIRNPPSPQPQP